MKYHYEVWSYNDDLGGLEKTYPYKIQAIIYCFLKGYVYTGRGSFFLAPNVEIKKVGKNGY